MAGRPLRLALVACEALEVALRGAVHWKDLEGEIPVTMLEHALRAQSRGLHIFPVTPGLKVPHPKAGYRDAAGAFHGWGETSTNDRARIEYFWTHVDPRANIGVACKPSGLLVVDLDLAKEDDNLRGTDWAYMHDVYGPRVNGEELLHEMAYKLGGDKPSDLMTYTVRTGSGGLHLYYQWPEEWGQQSQASPVKGLIDVRGNGGDHGGYVLGEGSVTEAGPYVSIDALRSPQIAPEWIRQLVTPRPKVYTPRRMSGIQQPHSVSWSGLVSSVRNAGEGNRNNSLLWAARAMCTDGADEEEAKKVLGEAATSAGLGWAEIERTIESAYRVQRQKEGL